MFLILKIFKVEIKKNTGKYLFWLNKTCAKLGTFRHSLLLYFFDVIIRLYPGEKKNSNDYKNYPKSTMHSYG